MVKYVSIAVLLSATAVLLVDVTQADEPCRSDIVGAACAADGPGVAEASTCEDGAACEAAAPAPRVAVLHGAELPPLTDADLLIATPIGSGAPSQ